MKSPAFQFYPSDWLSSHRITLMTPSQEGAYLRLLCYDWLNDGIPDDDNQLSLLSRLGQEWFKGGSTVVKICFNQHPTKPGFITNERLQKERVKQQAWIEKSKKGGLNSVASRGLRHARVVQPKVNRPVEPKANIMSSSIIMSSNNKEEEVLTKKDSNSPKRQLTDLWCERFKFVLNAPYKFNGVVDGRGADELIKLGISNEELLSIAEKAWRNKGFWSKQAITLAGFASKFNQIREEVGSLVAETKKQSLRDDPFWKQ